MYDAAAVVAALSDNQRPQHTTAINKVDQRERGVFLTPTDPSSFAYLSLEDLITSANNMLEKMKAEIPGAPENMVVTSAIVLQNGGRKLIMNSKEAAQWLKNNGGWGQMRQEFDWLADLELGMYRVMIKFVPIATNIEEKGLLRILEEQAGVATGSFKKMPGSACRTTFTINL